MLVANVAVWKDVTAIPKISMGKIDRVALNKLFGHNNFWIVANFRFNYCFLVKCAKTFLSRERKLCYVDFSFGTKRSVKSLNTMQTTFVIQLNSYSIVS